MSVGVSIFRDIRIVYYFTLLDESQISFRNLIIFKSFYYVVMKITRRQFQNLKIYSPN